MACEEDSSISYAKGDAKENWKVLLMRNVPAFIPEPFMSSSRRL